jgi:hypothetical protein
MKRFLFAAVALAVSSSSFAADYAYKNGKDVETFSADISKGVVTTKYCSEKDKCREGKQDVEKLIEKLDKLIAGHQAELKDKEALIALAKKQAASDDAFIIDDKASQIKYVVLEIGSMRLPVPEEDVKKGDFSRVTGAIEANIRRYTSVLGMLKSGKLPKAASSDKYQDTAKVRELENIVAFADYLDNTSK